MCPGPASDRYFHLSDEDVLEFQRIIAKATGEHLSFEAARLRALELLDLFYLIHDPEGWEQRRSDFIHGYDLPRMGSLDTTPVLHPRPAPLDLQADHREKLGRALVMIGNGRHWVRARPTTWRYAVIALYEAVGHALVLTLGVEVPDPGDGLHHLTPLYDAALGKGSKREAIEQLEVLRTTYLPVAVSNWIVQSKDLPRLFIECLEIL